MRTWPRPRSVTMIDATLDYKAVTKRIISFVEDSDFQLIETMAERIAAHHHGRVRRALGEGHVHKPWAIRGSRDVGICIERGQPVTGGQPKR